MNRFQTCEKNNKNLIFVIPESQKDKRKRMTLKECSKK